MNPKYLMLMIKRFEEKLKELMGEAEYMEFSKEVAKEAFFAECTDLPDGEFKDFCIDNFGYVTSDDFKWPTMDESEEE